MDSTGQRNIRGRIYNFNVGWLRSSFLFNIVLLCKIFLIIGFVASHRQSCYGLPVSGNAVILTHKMRKGNGDEKKKIFLYNWFYMNIIRKKKNLKTYWRIK